MLHARRLQPAHLPVQDRCRDCGSGAPVYRLQLENRTLQPAIVPRDRYGQTLKIAIRIIVIFKIRHRHQYHIVVTFEKQIQGLCQPSFA